MNGLMGSFGNGFLNKWSGSQQAPNQQLPQSSYQRYQPPAGNTGSGWQGNGGMQGSFGSMQGGMPMQPQIQFGKQPVQFGGMGQPSPGGGMPMQQPNPGGGLMGGPMQQRRPNPFVYPGNSMPSAWGGFGG